MTTYPAVDEGRIKEIIEHYRGVRGALLPILHELQEEFGYVDELSVPLLADALNMTRADIHGVITFYHEFRRTRPGAHIVKVCLAEACQSVGANALLEHIKERIKADPHKTSQDGQFTLEPVFCLGNCALGPSMMVDDRIYGRVTSQRLEYALARATQGHEEDAL